MQARLSLQFREARVYPITAWPEAKHTLVDVYPVGIQYDLWVSARMLRRGMWGLAWMQIRNMLRLLRARVQRNRFRVLKLYLNGHLAEPYTWPKGLKLCGTGWTKKRALADLRRKMLDAGWESRTCP